MGLRSMIIDSHTHLWPGEDTDEDLAAYFKKRNIFDKISSILTAGGILQKMDALGIDKRIVASIALHSGMSNEDLMRYNSHVIDEVKKDVLDLCARFPVPGFTD